MRLAKVETALFLDRGAAGAALALAPGALGGPHVGVARAPAIARWWRGWW